MDFSELKEQHPNIRERLTKLEHEYKKAELLLEFADHPSVRLLLDGLAAIVADINEQLLSKRSLTLQERESLFIKRDCFEWLKSQFVLSENYIEGANAKVAKL